MFPQEIVTFPQMQDLSSADMENVKEYQAAMEAGNFTMAAYYLSRIQNASNKIINAQYINSITDTMEAVEKFYLEKYSPAYVVSATQPTAQETGDFWFQIV